ncbi:unnamed protein product, partial [Pocillopora meandrina]
VPSARDYAECNETKAGIANHLAFGNTHANDANDDWINVASTGSHSTKTYLWEPEALLQQSMMSNAHCVKRVNSCHNSEHPRGDKPVKMESPAASEAQPSNAQNDRPNDEALRCFMEVV